MFTLMFYKKWYRIFNCQLNWNGGGSELLDGYFGLMVLIMFPIINNEEEQVKEILLLNLCRISRDRL